MKKEVNDNSVSEQQTTPVEQNVQAELQSEPTIESQTNIPTEALTKAPGIIQKIGLAKIIAIAVVAVILVGGVVFKVASSTPKAIVKSTIGSVTKKINKVLDDTEKLNKKYKFDDNAILLKGDINFDTNISDVDFDLSKYTIGAELGIDNENQRITLGGNIKGSSEQISINALLEDSYIYLTSNLLDETIKIESDSSLKDFFEGYSETLEATSQFDTDDISYMVKTLSKALQDSIESDFVAQEKDEIDIAGKSVKATRTTLTINDKAAQKIIKSMATTLLDDNDFIKKLAKMTDTDKDDIKEGLKNLKSSAKEIEFDTKVKINFYTKGVLNTLVGVDFSVDKEEYLRYYFDDKNFIIKVNADEDTMQITGQQEKKEQKITVKYNDEKVATATVRSFDDKLIDLDFKTTMEDEDNISGSIYLSFKEEKTKISGDYKIEFNNGADEYIKAKGSYSIESKKELDGVKTSDAVSVEDIDEDKLLEKIKDIAEKDDAFNDLYESTEDEIEEAFKPELNYIGMADVSSKEDIEKVLKKSKATVLYVGDRNYYYSYYGNNDAYNLLNDLKSLQEELDFYSYYLYENSYYVSDFEALVKDVTPVCGIKQPENTENQEGTENNENTEPTQPATCEKYPAIYLIKDGKVQKAFQAPVTKEELKTALKDLGI